MRRTKGFTLIELLIVIAIILILVAIAVPNFAAARIRAQVARLKADMKTIVNGLEAYHTDYHRYLNPYASQNPPCHPELAGRDGRCPPFNERDDGRCIAVNDPQCLQGPRGDYLLIKTSDGVDNRSLGRQLTTPSKFLTEIPIDPFMTAGLSRSDAFPGRYGDQQIIEAASAYLGAYAARVTYAPAPYNVIIDRDSYHMQSFGPDYVQDGDQRGGTGLLGPYIYSPTNGAKSYGDIRYFSQFGFADEFKG